MEREKERKGKVSRELYCLALWPSLTLVSGIAGPTLTLVRSIAGPTLTDHLSQNTLTNITDYKGDKNTEIKRV